MARKGLLRHEELRPTVRWWRRLVSLVRPRVLAAPLGLVFTLLPSVPVLATEPLPSGWEDEVVEYVESEMAELAIPGAAVAIVHDSEVAFARGFGVANPDGDPVTPETPFHIASVSKSLTALAVMQLVEAGALALDDTLGSLIPDLAAGEAGAVTVRNLLTHSSGWTEQAGSWIDPDPGQNALEDNAQRIVNTPLGHPIGVFEYSNANYDVLGYVVERISGDSFGDYMAQHVFGPLDMSHTFTSEDEAQTEGLATGYYPYFGIVRPLRGEFLPGRVPSGQMMSSAGDLSHSLIAHLNEGRFGDASLLSPAGIRLLHQPTGYADDPCCGYAMGLWVFPLYWADRLVEDEEGFSRYEVPVVLEHNGSGPSAASGIIMLPEQKIGVVVLLNINDGAVPSLYHNMHHGIAHILLDVTPRPTIAFESLLARNGKLVALIVLAGFLLRAGISAMRVRRLTRATSKPPLATATALRKLVIPMAVDLALVGGVWWLLLNEADAPLASIRRAAPDIFWTLVVATVIALGWALTRSVLLLRAFTPAKKRIPAMEREADIPTSR